MGLEYRSNNVYFYEKRRINGRVVSSYGGSGIVAECAAFFKASERKRKAQAQAAWDAERRQVEQHDGLYNEVAAACRQLAAALLLASGYHQHKGTWRQRRMTRTKTFTLGAPRPATGDTSEEALIILMERCNDANADPKDVEALRALIPLYPDIANLSDRIGKALEMVASQGLGLHRATGPAYIEQRKKAFGYAQAAALEQPLILHLILCEQRLGIAEREYTAMQNTPNLSLKQARFYDDRLNTVQARYLKAVETLARIRRVRVEAFASDGAHSAGMAVERLGA